MDNRYLIDDYVEEKNISNEEYDNADNFLFNYQKRVKGSKTITEFKKEVSSFLYQNQLPQEIREKILKICEKMDEKSSIIVADNEIYNILSSYKDEVESKKEEANSELEELRDGIIDDISSQLEEHNVILNGNTDELKEQINTKEDVYKLETNVDNAVEYLDNQEKLYGDSPKVELDADVLSDAINSSGDETILNEVLDEQDSINDSLSSDVNMNNDGSIQLNGDFNRPDSFNFAMMMVLGLVSNDKNIGLSTDLDTKFIKNGEDLSKFRMIFGNFPITNENRIDPVMFSKIQEFVSSYRTNTSYIDLISKVSPELALSFDIVKENVFNQKGAFQMAVRNDNGKLKIVYGMDENYQELTDAFNTNGAIISNDGFENSIVRCGNSNDGDDLVILSSVKDTMRQNKQDKIKQEQLQNIYQKKLLYPTNQSINNEAANVNYVFLIVVGIVDVLLLLSLFWIM